MTKTRSAPALLLSAAVLTLGGPQGPHWRLGGTLPPPVGRAAPSVLTVSVGPFGALQATAGHGATAWSLMIFGVGLAGAAARRRRTAWLRRLEWEAPAGPAAEPGEA